jgi:hypothetical protein
LQHPTLEHILASNVSALGESREIGCALKGAPVAPG